MFTTKNLLILIGKHAAIALGAVGIAAFASYFFAHEIKRVSGNIIQNHRLASSLEKRTGLFSTIARDIQIVGKSDTLIENAFVPSDNIFEFISVLESLALKNAATQSLNFDNPSPSSISAPFPLSIIGYQNTLALNVFGFTNYLKDFERLPYFTKIESLNISSSDPQGWRGAANVSFRASFFTKTAQ